MVEHRIARLYQTIARHDGSPLPFHRLQAICHAAMELLGVSGVGVMLMANRVHQGTAYATDPTIRSLEDMQNAAADGPCIDAYNLGRPVLEPDLAGAGRRAWPLLAAAAVDAGMRAVFGFPLQLDDTCMGALDLYRDRPGPLTSEQIDDGRLLAAMAAREVLAMQADARPGTLPDQIADLSGDRAAIEQATGMIAAQLNAPITEAAGRIRQLARDKQRPLAAIAHDVIARRLRLN